MTADTLTVLLVQMTCRVMFIRCAYLAYTRQAYYASCHGHLSYNLELQTNQ